MRTVGTVSWLPVFLGGFDNHVCLVPLSTSTTPGTVPTYDDSDVVRLPNNGSIGRRFTEWDTHAVYGVHPTNWAYLIAPDIVANDMKYNLRWRPDLENEPWPYRRGAQGRRAHHVGRQA
jgi:hypothetical protein